MLAALLGKPTPATPASPVSPVELEGSPQQGREGERTKCPQSPSLGSGDRTEGPAHGIRSLRVARRAR